MSSGNILKQTGKIKIDESPVEEILEKKKVKKEKKLFENIQTKLENFRYNNEKLFNEDQIYKLTSIQLKYNLQKINLISLELKDVLYEVVSYCTENPTEIDSLIDNLEDITLNNENLTPDEILFKSRIFKEQEKYYFKELENSRVKINIQKGLLPCPKCKTKMTLTVEKQTRSGDEGTTLFNSCTKCGHKWKVQN